MNDDVEPETRVPELPVEVPIEAWSLGAYGAKFLPLHVNSKKPSTSHGRHDAADWDEFFKLDNQNYGIKLDGWAMVVDFDRPDCDTAKFLLKRLAETPTWRQKTKKGQHWLFLLPPDTVMRGGKLLDGNGDSFGEILSNAYIVGPGSRLAGEAVYELVEGCAPVLAPDWLIEHARTEAKTALPGATTTRRDRIPAGERDNALASILGQIARSHAGLSEQALIKTAKAMIDAGLVEDGDDYLRQDPSALQRLARSAVSFGDRKPEVDALAMLPEEWRSGADVDPAPIPVAWLTGLEGLIPAVGLALLYGDGKVGKTSLLAWLAAKIITAGKGVIYLASGETTFDEFVRMVAMYGADTSMIYEYPSPELFMLPSKCAELEKALEILGGGISVVLIDAVYSHFETTPGSHEAARARFAMKPLNMVAQRRGLAILATLHENASGNMLGSKEMRNVARSVVHAIRKPGFPLTIYGTGANVPQVDYGAVFEGTAVPIPGADGKPLVYKDFMGDDVAQSVWKLDLTGKVSTDGSNAAASPLMNNGVDLAAVPDPQKRSRKTKQKLDDIP